MQKRYLLLIVALLWWMPERLAAKHIIGGVITYEYLGPGTEPNSIRYKFTLEIYRDCGGGGADFDQPAEVTIYEETSPDTYTLFSSGGEFISNKKSIPLVPMPCMSPPNVCVEQATYVFEKELPNNGHSFYVCYQRCCRNESIVNISTPDDVGATYSIEITPEAMNAKSSSPRFSELPPIVICNDFPIDYDHSAIDPDADQLVYSFCSPLKGGGPVLNGPGSSGCNGVIPIPACPPPFNPVNFIQPAYSPSQPMAGNPVISINPVTGVISGTPHQIGQYVVGVCVKEYRNGVLLSTVRREFQFNVADCQPDILADVKKDSIIGFKNYVINSCGSNTIQFFDQSIGGSNITSYYWEFDLNNGTIATSIDKNPYITFPDTGAYVGKLVINRDDPCSDSAQIHLNVFPAIHADFTFDYDTCIAGPVAFTDLSNGEGGIYDWDWSFGEGGSDKAKNPTYLYNDPGVYPVSLRIEDGNHCVDDTTRLITWQPAPADVIVAPSTFHGCIPAHIFFDNLSSPIDSTYTFEWSFSDGSTDSIMSPTHLFDKEGLYTVSLKITSPIGCEVSDVFPNWIQVLPSPVAAFDYTILQQDQHEQTIQFEDQSIDAIKWFWFFDSLGTSQLQNPEYTFQDTGRHEITLRILHESGCVDTATAIIDFLPDVLFVMPNAFTPNQDTRNDLFLGKGYTEYIRDFKMTIWNRWGEMIFETNNPKEGWNGRRFNTGRPSPPGVYVYVVKYTDSRGNKELLRGFATLIR